MLGALYGHPPLWLCVAIQTHYFCTLLCNTLFYCRFWTSMECGCCREHSGDILPTYLTNHSTPSWGYEGTRQTPVQLLSSIALDCSCSDVGHGKESNIPLELVSVGVLKTPLRDAYHSAVQSYTANVLYCNVL